MRGMDLVAFVVMLTFFALPSFAEEEESVGSVKIRPGMEVKRLGDANILVPEGAELRREGGVVAVESTAEWAARRFKDMEERLSKLETAFDTLEKALEELKKTVEEAGDAGLVSR